MSQRAKKLAERIEQGAAALAGFAEQLSAVEWQAPIPGDGRAVGVVVHHVASVYPLEVQVAQTVARGEAVTGVTFDSAIREMNAKHAKDNASPDQKKTVELLRLNSQAAADAVRNFTDEELDSAAAVSLNEDAPLTAQFVIEDHALRHSFHHLFKIRAALKR